MSEAPASPRAAILTRSRDFHAEAIAHALQERGVASAIVLTDALAASGGMSWSTSGEIGAAVLPDVDGRSVRVGELDLIWWRRLTGEPRLPPWLDDEAARDLVTRDCRATLFGIALTEFAGRWISHPEATRLAENKLVQLHAARAAGLRVPRTLVSQDPRQVRAFCAAQGHEVIVKTVAGTPLTPVMTGKVSAELLADDSQIALSPAIYQSLVPGRDHLRVCCFGDRVHAVRLTSERLDWRYPLDADAEPYDLDDAIAAQLRAVLAQLDLAMGIFDLKLDPAGGEPYWLEVNPQGQFLFLEGLCDGLALTAAFTDFLIEELDAAGRAVVAAGR